MQDGEEIRTQNILKDECEIFAAGEASWDKEGPISFEPVCGCKMRILKVIRWGSEEAKKSCYMCCGKLEESHSYLVCMHQKQHGAHLSCLKLQEKPVEKRAALWFCRYPDCLQNRMMFTDRRLKQMFPEFIDEYKVKWYGQFYNAPTSSGGFSYDLGRNGFPSYKVSVGGKNHLSGIRCGACCNNIDRDLAYQCEHCEAKPPARTKDQAKDAQCMTKHKLWRFNGLKMWGAFAISDLRDVLIKICQKENPNGITVSEVEEYRDSVKICAGKATAARDLQQWKQSIIDYFDSEVLPCAQHYVLVNVGLSIIDRLSDPEKSQYESLCTGLQENKFGDYSRDIRSLPDIERVAVLGIANHIAANKGGKNCIGAIRLMKTPAQCKICVPTEEASFQNATALLLDGTGTLRVGKRGDCLEEKMFFGESRSGKTITNTDEKIVLKYVKLDNQEHEFFAAEQPCVWFLVNFFRLDPTTRSKPV